MPKDVSSFVTILALLVKNVRKFSVEKMEEKMGKKFVMAKKIF